MLGFYSFLRQKVLNLSFPAQICYYNSLPCCHSKVKQILGYQKFSISTMYFYSPVYLQEFLIDFSHLVPSCINIFWKSRYDVELYDQNQEGNSEKLSPNCVLKLRSQKGVLPKHKSQVKYIALQGRGNLLQCCSYSYPPQ